MARLIVFLIIASFLAMAVTISLLAKPLNAAGVIPAKGAVNRPMLFVCKPAIFTIGPDAPKPIVRT